MTNETLTLKPRAKKKPVADMPLVKSEQWRQEVIEETDGLQDVYGCLKKHFPERVLLNTDRPFDFTGYTNGLTGEQIHDLGFKIANALVSIGAVPTENSRVIIAKQNHADYFFYTHSIIRASGIAVIVNAKTRLPFISKVQEISDSKYIITDSATLLREDYSDELHALTERGVTLLISDKNDLSVRKAYPFAIVVSLWSAVEYAPATVIPHRNFSDDSPLAIFHTSGTTGVPKLCVYDVRTARETWKPAAAFPLTENSRRMSGLPCAHAIYFMAQTGAFLGGAWTYLPSKFNPKAWLTALQNKKITYFLGFPYAYMRMAAERDLHKYKLDSMQGWMSGGDTAHAAHIEKFKKFGKKPFSFNGINIKQGSFFINPYGSTEIAGAGIYQFSLPGQTAEPCRVGKPGKGVGGDWAMKIVDENNQEVKQGEVGRILLGGEYAPPGYWNRSDLWHANRYDGWTWIGDVGYVDTEGVLRLMDREVDRITTKDGFVYSLAVEEAILQNDDVMEAGVAQHTTDQDARSGDAVALIVPRGYLDPKDDCDWSELENKVLKALNRQFKPGVAKVRAVALSELPLGCTGKLLKRQIRERLDRGWLS